MFGPSGVSIGHLSNRRVRTVGEQLYNQFGVGLARMARTIRERMNVRDNEVFTPIDLINAKTISSVINTFFGTNALSQFMDQTNPDIRLHIHIADDDATLCLDSSGESLHRRGYRQESVEAPLNEVLAAGMILMTGWKGDCDLIDPMCGSGTIAIEAALIARNISPGVFQKFIQPV